MDNTIIFGSKGFIGTHFINTLKDNSRIFEFDIISSNYEDVRKPISIEGEFGHNDIIFNLAAIHRTPGHPNREYFETNIRGAENVCEFAEKKGINNIIFASSIAPYGASEELKTEDTLPMPNSPYGISKLTAEYIHTCWQLKDPQNRKLLIIRPGVVFGYGENGNFTRLYNSIKKGTFFYPGRKDTVKACIYVNDLVDLALQINSSFSHGVKLYNFTYEPAYTIQEIVETICMVTGIKPPKTVVSGKLLKAIAGCFEKVGGRKLGIHPERVNKLMVSTNICGKKIVEDGFSMKFGLHKGVKDWYLRCNQKGLF